MICTHLNRTLLADKIKIMECDNMIFGYCRVSSIDQNVERQIEAIQSFTKEKYDCKINKDNLYIDKSSGKDFNRESWLNLLRYLRKDDILIIKELDRLGRDKLMIVDTLNMLKDRGVRLHVLDVPTTLICFDEKDEYAKSMMEMVNNVLIEVLSTIAEAERKRIKARQAEGIAIAQREGKYSKERRKLKASDLPSTFPKLYKKWRAGFITAKEFTLLLNLKSRSTLYRWVKIYESEVLNKEK